MNTLMGTTALGLTTSIAKINPEQGKKMVEHGVNFQKAKTKLGLATAATAGGTYAALKSSSINKGALKIINKVKNTNTFKKLAPTVTDFAKGVATKFKALPASGKAIVAAGAAIGGLLIGKINDKYMQNYGKIEQKYEDKSKIREEISEQL